MSKNRKLIVIDLDGTALKDERELHPETKDALIAAKNEGHIVCIATGRPERAAIQFYNDLGLNTLMANYNGGYISNPSDKNYVPTSVTVSKNVVHDIFTDKIVREHLKDAICEHPERVYAYNYTKTFLEWFHGNSAVTVEGELADIVDVDVNAILLLIDGLSGIEHIEKIVAKYPDLISRVWSVKPDVPSIIEINSIGGNKGMALNVMSKYYNISLTDTYAFGDMDNDIEMMEVCPNSVAMKNGSEKCKAAARYVSSFNNHEGAVGKFIKENVLSKDGA